MMKDPFDFDEESEEEKEVVVTRKNFTSNRRRHRQTNSEEVETKKKQKKENGEEGEMEKNGESIMEVRVDEVTTEVTSTDSPSSSPPLPPSPLVDLKKLKVVYVHSEALIKAASIPVHPDRACLVHELISSYGLLSEKQEEEEKEEKEEGKETEQDVEKTTNYSSSSSSSPSSAKDQKLPLRYNNLLKVVSPKPATVSQLGQFHSEAYLEQLQKSISETHSTSLSDQLVTSILSSSSSSSSSSSTNTVYSSQQKKNEDEEKEGERRKNKNKTKEEEQEEEEEFGLVDDCASFVGIWEHTSLIAGATLTACQQLLEGKANIVINWTGGRHHAHREEASGFCYVNDIVLGILELMEGFDQVLYVDIDIHHGDAVEEAFRCSSSVTTLSFHLHEPGFFPGTGGISSNSELRKKVINVPLPRGVDDDLFFMVFEKVITEIHRRMSHDCVIFQCGVDGLVGDPLGGFNLTQEAYGRCLSLLKDLYSSEGIPMLLLGGGGYCSPNAARCWTFLTALSLGLDFERKEDKKDKEKRVKKSLSNDIPEENPHFEFYGPDFVLKIRPSPPLPPEQTFETRNRAMQSLQSVLRSLEKVFPSPTVSSSSSLGEIHNNPS